MAGFRDIVGHERIISYMKNAVLTGRTANAYILNGPEGSGKNMLAEAFAMLLECESPREGEPCMECLSCRQAMGRNQPDIIRVTHEKTVVSVDDVREQITRGVGIRPYRSNPRRVFIVDEAERMNVQAQNALLKTLEEPPDYVVIMLLTTNADLFLPTVLSRCVRLNLRDVEDEKIKAHLMRHCSVPEGRADLCTAFARGNVGRAMELASSERLGLLTDRTFNIFIRADDLPVCSLVREAEEVSGQKEDIPLFLDLLLLLFRDVLLYKATGGDEGLIFKDRASAVRQIAGRCSLAGINRIFSAIETAGRRIGLYVNSSLTLEMLLIEIKENME